MIMKYIFLALITLGLSSYALPYLNINGGDEPYKACCGAQPVFIKVGKETIFVPNIFTPNGDGLNDVFRIDYNTKTLKVAFINIKNDKDQIVWKTEKYSLEAPLSAWTGRMSKDSVYTGLFHYTIGIQDQTGAVSVFYGSACSAVCNPKIPINIADKDKCFFPMQYPRDSFTYKSVLHLEMDCLKK
jgi:hypothetical protein